MVRLGDQYNLIHFATVLGCYSHDRASSQGRPVFRIKRKNILLIVHYELFKRFIEGNNHHNFDYKKISLAYPCDDKTLKYFILQGLKPSETPSKMITSTIF